MIERQRQDAADREAEERRKLQASETRLDIKVEIDYTEDDRRSAMEKLQHAAEG